MCKGHVVFKNGQLHSVLEGSSSEAMLKFNQLREFDFLKKSPEFYTSFSSYLASNHWHMQQIKIDKL